MEIEIGNYGGRVRSDCSVKLTTPEERGKKIIITSKVRALYGKDIEKRAEQVLSHYQIENYHLEIYDSGSLPFVLEARLDAAIQKLSKQNKPFLPEQNPINLNESKKEQQRTTRLYLPGNSPSFMMNAGLHKPKGLILDLEDSVAPDKKYEARFLVRNALIALNFYGAERMVRINQFPLGKEDLPFIVPYHVNMILVPKVETAEQIVNLNKEIDKLKKEHNIHYNIWLMPIIESALGVENAFAIAQSATNVVSMAIGLEDYTADLGVQRTDGGEESLYARNKMVSACKAAGIQAIDSVFSDVNDMEKLYETAKKSKQMGFDGMGCIHPRQIQVIESAFAPTAKEIDYAKRVVHAFEQAQKEGRAAVSLGSKMIDPPVVKRAEKVITTAIPLGLISENWRDEFLQENN